jgi:SAM-dependent methyltransferase
MRLNRTVFDGLAAEGKPGQMLVQGMDNYYETDPVESENFGRFVAEVPARERVLVAGCGDAALEAELLVRLGFEVVAFDESASAIEVARDRFEVLGLPAEFFVADVTRLDTLDAGCLALIAGDFGGVMIAQVAQFIPCDGTLTKAIRDSVSLLAPGGILFLSTTRYPETLGHGVIDTTYYGRSTEALATMISSSGVTITHEQFFDSAAVLDGETYQNQYFIGTKKVMP